MKNRIFILFLIAILTLTLCACHPSVEERLDAVEDTIENRADQAEDALEDALDQARSPGPATAGTEPPALSAAPDSGPAGTAAAATEPVPTLTPEEAEAIALAHAGFTAEQVKHLHTEYDWDDGAPEYEVQFRVDRWEYEYDIHAETGAIRSYDKDD